MKTEAYMSVKIFTITLVILSLLFILSLPSITSAQTGESQNSLLNSIRAIFDESFKELSKEVQSLKNEVQTLRAEVRQLQSGGSGSNTGGSTINITSPLPSVSQTNEFVRTLRTGDSGDEVRRLQEVLISLGYDIPAGITGNFFSQTKNILSQLQKENNLPVTGTLDQATMSLLNRLMNFQQTYSPPPKVNEPKITTPEQPIITPGLTLVSPQDGFSLNAGSKITITWKTNYAPAGAIVSFHLTNKITGVRRPVYETSELTGTYEWTVPSNMPSNNDFEAELLYKKEGSNSSTVLSSRTVKISIFGGTTETTTSTTVNTSNTSNTSSTYADYVDFYTGTAFTTCMANYPETISLIKGWLDQGLLRYQFPWGEITGPAATKVAECEGNQFSNYASYGDCTLNANESTCSSQPGCKWFDTFCSGDNYDPLTGGGQCTGTTKESCTSVTNCHWYEGSGSTPTEMYKCYYPNATINGVAPGYTVWCEYDYQNCRQGDPNGASVSLNGLSLGAPSACENGWPSSGNNSSYCYYDATGSAASASNNSFIANVLSAFSRVVQKIFGF